ncbi:unnamed protein product [Caenorhabditis angaria]|uniref:C2H2-type domain-containing protein n=1 Tax=Caenorhabditis angaria TaxID=860376 RepID=A0A9P1MWX4_9PELO|nr:unnamed protein product [Caenorhabditis angaria]
MFRIVRSLLTFQAQNQQFRHFSSPKNRSKFARKSRNFEPKIVPNLEPKLEEIEVFYPPDDLDPKKSMLPRICEELKQKSSHNFILPASNSYLFDQIVVNLEELINKHGVRPEFVLDAFLKNPRLFRCFIDFPEESLKICRVLVEFANFSMEDSMRILALFPDDLLKHGATNCAENIQSISACGLSAPRQIHSMIKRCPPLIFARDPQEMRKVAHELGAFFSRKQSSQLILKCPEVLLKPIEEIEEKYEYVFYQMGAEPDELSECKSWIEELSWENLKNRHTFLQKTGKYSMPDPKRPQIRLENPKMFRIIDSSDEDFSQNVAKVSLEEWMVYQTLMGKLEENEHKERKFERIKPSKRKAFERRYKSSEKPEDHVFDIFECPMYSYESQQQHWTYDQHPPPSHHHQIVDSSTTQQMLATNTGQIHPQETKLLATNNKIEDSPNAASAAGGQNSSSSCSPATPQQQHNDMNPQQAMQQAMNIPRHDELTPADFDRVVGIMNTHTAQKLEQQPLDLEYMHMMQTRLVEAHQQHQQHLFQGFGRPAQLIDRHQSTNLPPIVGANSSSTSSGQQQNGGGNSGTGGPAPTRRSRSVNDGMLKCQFCPKKWVNERSLHVHMTECRLSRTHECPHCGKRFKARGGLQQHSRIHANDRAYTCQFCQKTFTQKSHLDQHERIHTGAKPFVCQHCGRQFRQRSQQIGHEATHSSGSNRHSQSTSASGSNPAQNGAGGGSGSSSSGGSSGQRSEGATPSPVTAAAAAAAANHVAAANSIAAAAAMMHAHHHHQQLFCFFSSNSSAKYLLIVLFNPRFLFLPCITTLFF